jgi:PAS domain S-box-containing protein
MLPGMDGFEICEKLKCSPRTKDIPVIFITALRNESDIIKGLKIGGSDYLGKPFNQEELIARVKTHLSLKLSRDLILQHNERLQEEILKQEKTKRALALSEEKFKKAFNFSPSLMVIAKVGLQSYIDVNEAFCKITGFSKEFVIGKNSVEFELFAEAKDRSLLFEEFQKYGSVINKEMILRKKDRTFFPALVSLEKMTVNEEACYLGVITDISERKSLEQSIAVSNARYKKISYLTSDFAFCLNYRHNNYDVEWLFGSYYSISGYRDDDVREYQDFQSFISDKFSINAESFTNTLSSGETIECQTTLKTAFGTTLWLRIYLEPELNSKLELVKIYGAVKDITRQTEIEAALKSSEARFKKLTEAANSLIGELDSNSNFIYANQAFTTILGLNPDKLIGSSFTDLMHPEDAKIVLENCRNLLYSGTPQECIIRLKNANNEYLWFNCNGNLLEDSDGVQKIVFVCIDINARVIAEDAVKESAEKLKALNANKDKFFSIIAHDLKGPVSSFKYALESIKTQFDDIDRNELAFYIKDLSDNMNSLYELLEDLLEWARTQTGKIAFVREEFSIRALLDNIKSICSSLAAKKEITLIFNLEADLYAYADVQMISTVIRNLVSNSIKFTNVGGIIQVSANIYEQDDDYIEIEVKDNGIGMTKDKQTKLFSIDNNISSPGTNDEKGTGLGLILCKEFVEKNGGAIRLESQIGVGTSFYFTAPKSKENTLIQESI